MTVLNKIILVFLLMVQIIWGFIELYETEHAQHSLTEEINEMEGIAKAQQLIHKMKNGVGGTTTVIHRPSGRKFIHRNKWIMICNGDISKENGHCNGDPLQSLTAFKIESPTDVCFLKNHNSINGTLCLSPNLVKIAMENNTFVCEASSEFFPAVAITIDEYLNLCESVSSNVTYVYYANPEDPEHVEIPNDNPHVRCDNEVEESTNNRTVSTRRKKFLREFDFAINRSGVCVFTEQDKIVLKLLEYLQL